MKKTEEFKNDIFGGKCGEKIREMAHVGWHMSRIAAAPPPAEDK